MDKQTLSHYGWIIIVVLLLAVMLAFATPFGKYIGRGVSNIAMAMGIANDNAVKEENIGQLEDEWDKYLNASAGSATFNQHLLIPGCHVGAQQHEESCFVQGGEVLSWDDLKKDENGDKYGYYASRISDTEIGEQAFYNCRLTTLVIKDGVKILGSLSCVSKTLETVVIPNTVTEIRLNAFAFAPLKNCTIPKSVTTLGVGIFAFSSVETIKYEGTMIEWNAISKDGWNTNGNVKTVVCADGTINV